MNLKLKTQSRFVVITTPYNETQFQLKMKSKAKNGMSAEQVERTARVSFVSNFVLPITVLREIARFKRLSMNSKKKWKKKIKPLKILKTKKLI